jgi:hypothetical protein
VTDQGTLHGVKNDFSVVWVIDLKFRAMISYEPIEGMRVSLSRLGW